MKPYRQAEWKPVASSDTALSLQSYVENYERSGYETKLQRDSDRRMRLYVRAEVAA